MSKITQYIKDTRGEMRHVAWPTQSQTVIYTALVVILSILTALYLGFFDFLFTRFLDVGLEALYWGGNGPSGLDTATSGAEAIDISDFEFEFDGEVPEGLEGEELPVEFDVTETDN